MPKQQQAAKTLNPTKAAAYIGVSRSSPYRLASGEPTFPKPVQLLPGRVAYIVAELDD